jgi:hypothetical protein
MAAGPTRASTATHPIKPTSTRCPSAWPRYGKAVSPIGLRPRSCVLQPHSYGLRFASRHRSKSTKPSILRRKVARLYVRRDPRAARLTTCRIRGLSRQAGTEPHAWETGQMSSITYVGLDVHKTIAVAVAEGGRSGEVRQLGIYANRADVLRKMVERPARGGSQLCTAARF